MVSTWHDGSGWEMTIEELLIRRDHLVASGRLASFKFNDPVH